MTAPLTGDGLHAPARILYVDGTAARDETAAALERVRADLSVEAVADGDAALSMLDRREYDCVVVAWRQSVEAGLAILRRVRSAYHEVPVVVDTSSESERATEDALRSGATDVVQTTPGCDGRSLLAARVCTAARGRRASRRATVAESQVRSLVDDVLDTCEEGLVVVDADGAVVWTNRAATDYFGFIREEVLGRPEQDLIAGAMTAAVTEGDAFAETLLSTAANGTTTEWTWKRGSDGENRRRLRHWCDRISTGAYTGGHVRHFVTVPST
jgi:PAS domain S-box-containing protein